MALRDRIIAAQEAALRKPWSHATASGDLAPTMIEMTDRIRVGISINK